MVRYTDTELLDFLQHKNDDAVSTGKCVMRDSVKGRGWRLHETFQKEAVLSVREAIANYMDNETITIR